MAELSPLRGDDQRVDLEAPGATEAIALVIHHGRQVEVGGSS